MELTSEQRAIVDFDEPAHLVVRAVPGSGKTTTLVHRVAALVARGVPASSIQVVMFNRAVRDTCVERLGAMGVPTTSGVKVNTFDSLALRLIYRARDQGLTRDLHIEAPGEPGRRHRIDQVHRRFREAIEDTEDLERAIDIWRAHLVPPRRARFDPNPAIVEAYAAFEELRTQELLRLDVTDYNYTAVGILRKHGRIEPAPTHLLVDEFQDVNPARVALIAGIAGERTRIVAVGDEDQGINEWCGSHPRYFRAFAEHFPQLPARLLPLSTSFRLGSTLADAANALIRHNTTRTPATIVPGSSMAGVVQSCTDLPTGLAAVLKEGVQPGELAVLYRSRLEGAAVLSALARAGVPIFTEDGYLLKRGAGPDLLRLVLRAAVSDTVARPDQLWTLARATANYVRKEPFAEACRIHAGHGVRALFSDRALHRDLGQGDYVVRDLAEAARALDRIAKAGTAKAAIRALDELVDADTVLRIPSRSQRAQDQAVACYEALCDWLSAQALPPAELDAAIEGLDLTSGRAPAECVYANTVHKAKGLEWPVVVVAGVHDGAFPAEEFGESPGSEEYPDGFEQSPFLEQERRTFYVAITRAKRQVVLHRPLGTMSTFQAELAKGLAPPPGAKAAVRVRRKPAEADGPAPPAAGRPWVEADDVALMDGWEAGKGCIALAAQFQRSTGAIVARLVRLGVVESRDEARRRV